MRKNTISSIWEIPTSVCVDGYEIPIRTDFRVVLDLLNALEDPEMVGNTKEETDQIQALLMLEIMVPDYENVVPKNKVREVLNAISDFIDMSVEDEIDTSKPHPKTMDWQQDARLIIPAVNKVFGHDIRADKYVHWWSFLSAYLEIGESTFSHILSIRQKKAKGKKLEKWEQEFARENQKLVYLKERKTEEEERQDREEKEALRRMIYGDRK